MKITSSIWIECLSVWIDSQVPWIYTYTLLAIKAMRHRMPHRELKSEILIKEEHNEKKKFLYTSKLPDGGRACADFLWAVG